MIEKPLDQRPRWKPIAQYRTFPLPILPILPPLKPIRYKVKAKVEPLEPKQINDVK